MPIRAMPIPSLRLTVAVTASLLSAACAPAAPGTSSTPARAAASTNGSASDAGPVSVQETWWRTFADGDTARLRLLSAPEVALTLSNARTFDQHGMLAESQRYARLPHPTLEWSDTAVVRSADGRVVLVAARLRETDPRGIMYARTLTVLERAEGTESGWRVLGAQSTREPQPYARLAVVTAGGLAEYAGQYRVPNGIVRVAVQDSALALTDPRGQVTRLEPVGPGLFEAVPPAGVTEIVRLLFSRDTAGRVYAVSRLTSTGLTTFTRVTEP